jgi:hypothetical protein
LKGNGAADPQMVDGLDQREMLMVVTALKKGDFSSACPRPGRAPPAASPPP